MDNEVYVRRTPLLTAGRILRRLLYVVLALTLIYFTLFGIFSLINPRQKVSAETQENARWVATSGSFLDRFSCNWFGICGGTAWLSQTWISPYKRPVIRRPLQNHSHPEDWINQGKRVKSADIPQFVFDYAPFVYLHENEQYWPSDIADHLHHVQPRLNVTLLEGALPQLSNLSSLDKLGKKSATPVYLTSTDDPTSRPEWLTSEYGIPLWDGKTRKDTVHPPRIPSNPDSQTKEIKKQAESEGWYSSKESPSPSLQKSSRLNPRGWFPSQSPIRASAKKPYAPGRSAAPAFLIVVDKGNGIIDAFWFYFYSFNQGQKVLGIEYGDHVGDWEHSMLRFKDGVPKAIFLSAHEWGGSYTYASLEKLGKRPVIYSAIGSHAMYPTAGHHTYALPFGLLGDYASAKGPLWDPVLNAKSFIYEPSPSLLRPSSKNPEAPTSWFDYAGKWGDKFYDLGDPLGRQYRFAGQYKFVNGPTGPKFKNLNRPCVCQRTDTECKIRGDINVEMEMKLSKRGRYMPRDMMIDEAFL